MKRLMPYKRKQSFPFSKPNISVAGCEFMSIIFTPNSIQIAQNTTNFNPKDKIERITLVLSIILMCFYLYITKIIKMYNLLCHFFYNRTYLLLYYGKKKRGLIHHTVDEGPRKTRKAGWR